MGGRDATNHIGLVAEKPSVETYDRAARTLARLCARAGGSVDELRVTLEAIGYQTPLKTRQNPEPAPVVAVQRKTPDSPAAVKPGARQTLVRTVPGTDLCGNRIHHMVGDNVGSRRDGRRYCKPCARNRGARRRASREGREHPEHIQLPVKDPNLCGKQLHPRTPENRIVRADGRTSCRPCNVRSQRDRRRTQR